MLPQGGPWLVPNSPDAAPDAAHLLVWVYFVVDSWKKFGNKWGFYNKGGKHNPNSPG
jgi:hypothetical protein